MKGLLLPAIPLSSSVFAMSGAQSPPPPQASLVVSNSPQRGVQTAVLVREPAADRLFRTAAPQPRPAAVACDLPGRRAPPAQPGAMSFRAMAAAALAESASMQASMQASGACPGIPVVRIVVGPQDQVVIPEYRINGGHDHKFETDPCEVELKGIIKPAEFFNTMVALNEALAPARTEPVDIALLASSLLVIPLIPWGVRHRQRKTQYKNLLLGFIDTWNAEHLGDGACARVVEAYCHARLVLLSIGCGSFWRCGGVASTHAIAVRACADREDVPATPLWSHPPNRAC